MAERECLFTTVDSGYLHQLEKAHEAACAECVELKKIGRSQDITIGQLRERNEDLAKRIEGHREKISEYEDIITDQKTKIEELKNENNLLRDRIYRKDAEIDELKKWIVSNDFNHRGEIEDLSHRNYIQAKMIREKDLSISEYIKEIKELRKERAELKKKLDEKDATLWFFDEDWKLKGQLNPHADTNFEELYHKYRDLWEKRGKEINRIEQTVREKNRTIDTLKRTMRSIADCSTTCLCVLEEKEKENGI